MPNNRVSTPPGVIAERLNPKEETGLRMGIFIDRANSKAVAVILNEKNNTWAPMTEGEHDIANADDADSVLDAMQEACADIVRWSETMAKDGE